MRREIVTYGGYFEQFLSTLSPKELLKLNYIISLLETNDRIPAKFIKFIRDGLYELRMEYNGNIYRVFFIKTPMGEIEKALKIKEAYYGDKRS